MMREKSKNSTPDLGGHLRDAYQDTVDEGVPDLFQDLIDTNLKRGLEDTLQEGIPDRFKVLLAQLNAAAAGDNAK